MNWLEGIVAAWLTRRLVKQGNHKRRITELYMMVRAQAELEFTEDNETSLTDFLSGCFHAANAKAATNCLFAKLKEPA